LRLPVGFASLLSAVLLVGLLVPTFPALAQPPGAAPLTPGNHLSVRHRGDGFQKRPSTNPGFDSTIQFVKQCLLQ